MKTKDLEKANATLVYFGKHCVQQLSHMTRSQSAVKERKLYVLAPTALQTVDGTVPLNALLWISKTSNCVNWSNSVGIGPFN